MTQDPLAREPAASTLYRAGLPVRPSAEVLASIESGLPLLRAEAEPQGQRALDALDTQVSAALKLVPA